MALKVIVGALGALVAVQPIPAHSRTATPAPDNAIDAVRFDLSESRSTGAAPATDAAKLVSRDASIGQVTREQADAAAAGRALPDPPAVFYEPVASGPVIELGAFGAKRKGMPGLVHLGVNWGF